MPDDKHILHRIQNAPTQRLFWCPGCKCAHHIDTAPGRWTLTGTADKPTINPSILVHGHDGGQPRCHMYVRDGQLQFLADCEHELKGKTVPMEKF